MREVANVSVDYTQVPTLLANPSGGKPDGVVVYSELKSLVDKVSSLTSQVSNYQDQLAKAQLEIAKLKLQQTSKPPSRLGGSMTIINSNESVLFRDVQSLKLPRVVVDLTVRQVEIDDRTVTVILPSDEDEIDPADSRAQIIVEFKGFQAKEYGLTYWSEKNGMVSQYNSNFTITRDPQLATFAASDLARAADPSGDDVYLDLGGIKSNRIKVNPRVGGAVSPDNQQASLLADLRARRFAAWEAVAPGTWDRVFDRTGWNGNEAIAIFRNGNNFTRNQFDAMNDIDLDRFAGVTV